MIDASNGKIILPKGSKINFLIAKKLFDKGLKNIFVNNEYFLGKYIHKDIFTSDPNQAVLKSATLITQESIEIIIKEKINNVFISKVDSINKGPYLLDTINLDKNNSKEEAINDIYKVLRPGEPPTFQIASDLFHNLFFKPLRYD